MKPSERIVELCDKDDSWTIGEIARFTDIDLARVLIDYLDEEWEKAQPKECDHEEYLRRCEEKYSNLDMMAVVCEGCKKTLRYPVGWLK